MSRIFARMMNLSILLPYLVFCILMTGTPGPNNAMALASGVSVGYRRTFPLISGIAIGVGLQLFAVGLGLGAIFTTYPPLHTALKIAGSLYLLWLAWKIATSGPVRPDDSGRPPIGFFGGMAFQWVNPKAWAMTTGAIATYVPPEDYVLNVVIASAIIIPVGIVGVSAWAAGGTALRRLLVRPNWARAFNLTVALLLVATTVTMLVGGVA